jgi:hypothetical protein
MKSLNQLIKLAGIGNSIEIMINKRITVATYDKSAGFKEIIAVEVASTAEEAIDACCRSLEQNKILKTA